jgi:hypothetical protein
VGEKEVVWKLVQEVYDGMFGSILYGLLRLWRNGGRSKLLFSALEIARLL